MPEHGLGRCVGHHKLVDCIEPDRGSDNSILSREAIEGLNWNPETRFAHTEDAMQLH
jgi:hypothetical protein